MRDEIVEQIHRENLELRQRIAQLEAGATPTRSQISLELVELLQNLVGAARTSPSNTASFLRRSINQELIRFLLTINPDYQFAEDKKCNQNAAYSFEAIQKAIAKLKQPREFDSGQDAASLS